MNLLDQKFEEKLKLFEEFDKIFANYQPNIVPLELSKKNINNSKEISISKSNSSDIKSKENKKFDNIYSNFDSNKNENAYYFRKYEEMMNYKYTLSSKVLTNNENSKKSKSKDKSKNRINQKKIKNDNSNNYKVQFMPKKDYVVEKLLRYGENLEKKKKRLRLENEKTLKKCLFHVFLKMLKILNETHKNSLKDYFMISTPVIKRKITNMIVIIMLIKRMKKK